MQHAAVRAWLLVLNRQALDLLDNVLPGLPDDGELLRQVMEYIVRVCDDADLDRLKLALRAAKQDRLEAFVGTIAETLLEQGEARGKAEGIAEGEAKTLVRLLERQFGPLPRAARERIATASIEQTRVDDMLMALSEAKGKVEGIAEGEAKTLVRLLERRFGPLPRSARERIAAAPLEQLDTWIDGVFDARSLDELLGEAETS